MSGAPCDECGKPEAAAYGSGYPVWAHEADLCAACFPGYAHRRMVAKDPEGYAASVEWVKAREAEARGDKQEATPPAHMVAAAVQRLCQEAMAREDAHPSPTSPLWIGRALEAEGRDRKLLKQALDQAIDEQDLQIVDYRNAQRSHRRAVRTVKGLVNVFG
jgi:hypothetical protein